MKPFAKDTRVRWKWGRGYGHGNVQSSFSRKVSRKIDGEQVTRNGSPDNPAYYVRVEDGNNVLKLHSELEKDD